MLLQSGVYGPQPAGFTSIAAIDAASRNQFDWLKLAGFSSQPAGFSSINAARRIHPLLQ